MSKCYTMPTTSGLREDTGLSVERPAGDFGCDMSTSGVRSLSKGANAIRRWRDGGTTVTAVLLEMITREMEAKRRTKLKFSIMMLLAA